MRTHHPIRRLFALAVAATLALTVLGGAPIASAQEAPDPGAGTRRAIAGNECNKGGCLGHRSGDDLCWGFLGWNKVAGVTANQVKAQRQERLRAIDTAAVADPALAAQMANFGSAAGELATMCAPTAPLTQVVAGVRTAWKGGEVLDKVK